jgi:hypothetical protein
MRLRMPAWCLAILAGLGVGTFAFAVRAQARECPLGCAMQTRACLHAARVDKLACKLGCRLTLPPSEQGACMRSCMDMFLGAKTACRSDHADCLEACDPSVPPIPPPPAPCLVGCGERLRICALGVLTEAKACVHGCVTAPDRLACLLRCHDAARTGIARCAADFHACVAGCGTTTSTTLPGPTCTLQQGQVGDFCGGTCPPGMLCLFDPGTVGVPPGCGCVPFAAMCELAGGSCNGLCPSPALQCAPPPPGSLTPLACLCQLGSPSGAFLD